MASYSKLIIVGHVGRDPELRMTPNGKPVCNFSVAVNRWAKKGAPEETDWYRCSVWGDSAERAQQYVTKGRVILIEGSLTPRTWQDREGKTNVWQLLDKKPTANGEPESPPPADEARF